MDQFLNISDVFSKTIITGISSDLSNKCLRSRQWKDLCMGYSKRTLTLRDMPRLATLVASGGRLESALVGSEIVSTRKRSHNQAAS